MGPLGDALRTFVNAQIAADAVARAMVEVHPAAPQRAARQHIELGPGRAGGKDRAGQGDMALEDTGEAVACLGIRLGSSAPERSG